MNKITELQTYLYDLQGYLVVEDVLDADQVAVLKAKVDQQDMSSLPRNHRFGGARS